jgi:hypothetical protein
VLEVVDHRTDEPAAMDQERLAGEPLGLGLLLLDVRRGDERAALGGEVGARCLGVAVLAPAVGIASSTMRPEE